MEGYTNLSLIKEEDFTKHGIGHMHGAKNSTKRVYGQSSTKNQRNQSLNHNQYQNAYPKARKASEASTIHPLP